ncbi:MAG: hypothetical protein DDT19_00548 [Syntrophomonadaceae bacterium]|nr:hypothetical protein [Bacillota bacterium]
MGNKPENIIMECVFGSLLYDTETANSDTDRRSVFMPSPKQVLLNRIPKSMTFSTKSGKRQNC